MMYISFLGCAKFFTVFARLARLKYLLCTVAKVKNGSTDFVETWVHQGWILAALN